MKEIPLLFAVIEYLRKIKKEEVLLIAIENDIVEVILNKEEILVIENFKVRKIRKKMIFLQEVTPFNITELIPYRAVLSMKYYELNGDKFDTMLIVTGTPDGIRIVKTPYAFDLKNGRVFIKNIIRELIHITQR